MSILETKTYRLLTLSPIHIKAGRDKEYGQGAIRLEPNDDFIYIIDTPALQRELFAFKGLEAVNAYAEAFSAPDPRHTPTIARVLDKIDYDYKTNIKKISKGIVRVPSGNRFMQSGLGQYFIPGSSIKGAIKTAVLYHLAKNQTGFDLDGFVIKRMAEYQSAYDRDKFKESFAEPILKQFFQSVHPRERTENKQRSREDKGPFTDFFRAIKVKDAMIEEKLVDMKLFAKTIDVKSKGMILQNLEGSEILLPFDNIPRTETLRTREFVKIEALEEVGGQLIAQKYTKVDEPVANKLELGEVAVISLQGNQPYERHRFGIRGNRDNRVECFSGETNIEISIDRGILRSFQEGGQKTPFTNLDDLITICQNFAKDQWTAEQEFLTNHVGGGGISLDRIKGFYKDSEGKASLRVGWGTGMLGTTVTLLLEDQRRKELRNEVISHDNRNRPLPAPKSRRFVLENDEPIYPLGWIQLSEVKK